MQENKPMLIIVKVLDNSKKKQQILRLRMREKENFK